MFLPSFSNVIGLVRSNFAIQELEHARSRSAHIYAELSGYGLSSDAYHMTAPRSDGQGPFLAMKHALRHAGLKPSAVDYINAHATSTQLGDAAENRAIKDLLLGEEGKERPGDINVSSTKGAIGHLLGAAGSVEAVFTVLAVKNVGIFLWLFETSDQSFCWHAQNTLPPTLNLHHPGDPQEEFNCNYVPRVPQQAEVSVALSNSFGFGGTNASLCFVKV
jgi:3-oxoacyl-[acyl-carrier-protein] synthase II